MTSHQVHTLLVRPTGRGDIFACINVSSIGYYPLLAVIIIFYCVLFDYQERNKLIDSSRHFACHGKFSATNHFIGKDENGRVLSTSCGHDCFLKCPTAEIKKTSHGYGSLNESDYFSRSESITPPPCDCASVGSCICFENNTIRNNFKDISNVTKQAEKIYVDVDKEYNNSDSDLFSFQTSTPNSPTANYANLTLPPKTTLSSDRESDDASSNEENLETNLLTKIKKSLTKFSKKEWFSLLGVCYVNCVSNASLSILSSFFSKEAISNHGVSELFVGLIFGCYAIINTLFCPIFGKLVPKVGPKRMLLVGLLVSSICSFGFSQLYRCTTTLSFIAGCFVVRGAQALGCAAYYTGATVTIAQVWRNDMTLAMGLGEVFSGIGMITGPLMGGWLYQEGGFQFPFIVVGVFMLIGICVNYFAAINVETTPTVGNFSTLLKIPNVAFTAVFTCVMWASMDFNMPLLSLHMQNIEGSSPVLVGTMFLIMAAAYTIFAPLVGIIAKTKIVERSLMVSGGFMVCISFLLIGPSPIFFPINFNKPSVVSISLSMVVLGVGISAALVPTFSDLKRSAVAGGMANDISTSGLVGGLFNGVTFFGEFIGPVFGGGLMNELHDYKIVSSVYASIVLFVVSGVTLFYLYDWRRNRNINVDSKDVETTYSQPQGKNLDETTPLLNPSV